jgi:hypothetical protein
MYLPVYAVALAPVLLVSTMVAKADSYPGKGMTTAQVEHSFGHPRLKSAPSGLPPITHWVYDTFTVYFDRDRVIFHIKSAGAQAQATAATAARSKTQKGKLKNPKPPVAAAAVAPVAARKPVPVPVPVPVAAAPVAAAPVAASVAAPAPAPVAAAPVAEAAPAQANLGTLMESEKSHAATPHTVAKPVEKKVGSSPSPAASSQPVVKAVTPMQAVRAGLVRVFQEKQAWYAGLAFGTSNYSTLASGECDESLTHAGFSTGCGKVTGDSAYKIYGGYNIMPMLAVEGGINQLGSSNFSTSVQQSAGFLKVNTVDISGKISSLIVNANVVLNLHPGKSEKADIGVKLGAYTAANDIKSSATGPGVNSRDDLNHSFNNSSTYMGLQGSYQLFGGLAAELEWNRFRNLGIANHASSRNVDTFLAGLQYTF